MLQKLENCHMTKQFRVHKYSQKKHLLSKFARQNSKYQEKIIQYEQDCIQTAVFRERFQV